MVGKIGEIIEWKTAGPEDIIYRYANDEFNLGSQLIVRENQRAIFFRDGKALDVIGPGRHTLTNLNLPELVEYLSTKYWGKIAFGETPFKCLVIFVSASQFLGKFGFRGMSTEYMPIMGHGQFWFRIEDPKLFVMEAVGNKNVYDTEELNSFLKSFINEKMINEVSNYDIKTVFTKLKEISAKIKSAVSEEFSRVGIELIDMKFEGVDTDERGRELLFRAGLVGKGGQLVVGGEIMKETAAELGKGSGTASIGAGMMIIPPLAEMMKQPQTQVVKIKCPKCGVENQADASFCSSCGSKLGKRQSVKGRKVRK